MPGEFWPEQLGEVASDPPRNVSHGFQRLQKSHLDFYSLSQSLWSSAELSSREDALKYGSSWPENQPENAESREQTPSRWRRQAGGRAASSKSWGLGLKPSRVCPYPAPLGGGGWRSGGRVAFPPLWGCQGWEAAGPG